MLQVGEQPLYFRYKYFSPTFQGGVSTCPLPHHKAATGIILFYFNKKDQIAQYEHTNVLPHLVHSSSHKFT